VRHVIRILRVESGSCSIDSSAMKSLVSDFDCSQRQQQSVR
jgi:hypothetical protein